MLVQAELALGIRAEEGGEQSGGECNEEGEKITTSKTKKSVRVRQCVHSNLKLSPNCRIEPMRTKDGDWISSVVLVVHLLPAAAGLGSRVLDSGCRSTSDVKV